MFRRQLILILLLAGVAYLWWHSRTPSRYAEWTEDVHESMVRDLEAPFLGPHTVRWAFGSSVDTAWRVSQVQNGLRHVRVETKRSDTATLRVYLELGPGTQLQKLTLFSAGKRLDIIPWGDSAQFISRADSVTESWIPWSRDALLLESIPALCDAWSPADSGQPVTLVRIQPKTEVVVQLPGRLQRTARGEVVLVTSGKELVRAVHDTTGRVSTLCLPGEACVQRLPETPQGVTP